MQKRFKVKRLRDGAILNLDQTHALRLLRLNAQQTKSEFELAEKNYKFSNNEIHRSPDVGNSKESEEQNED